MKITVENEREKGTTVVTLEGSSVSELLRHLQINPETVLVVRENEVLTEDEALKDNDSIKILSVISGG